MYQDLNNLYLVLPHQVLLGQTREIQVSLVNDTRREAMSQMEEERVFQLAGEDDDGDMVALEDQEFDHLLKAYEVNVVANKQELKRGKDSAASLLRSALEQTQSLIMPWSLLATDQLELKQSRRAEIVTQVCSFPVCHANTQCDTG
ncbi:hypothetical protein MIR68_003884 [Amoeboaphelidium protococcarum]|nr:hypothetical protein MIR68_003884 [Amoeboaphelidium protococcarum]